MNNNSIARRRFLQASALGATSTILGRKTEGADTNRPPKAKPYTLACYYFPNYHVDPRNEAAHGPGWSEWELTKCARPRFKGHQQPKVPLWGHEDEADPKVMAKKIDAAADHGVDAFIFDWYWYDNKPFLERCLNEGFLKAPNNRRLKFSLMWANHDWQGNLHPKRLHDKSEVLWPGTVDRKTFETLTKHVINDYFKHPSHWLIDGCPYFSIYDLGTLVRGFGNIEATRKALDDFRARTKAAGFMDLHLNAVVWGRAVLPGEKKPTDSNKLINDLGFDSAGSYVWVHHVRMPEFPQTPHQYVMKKSIEYWHQAEKKFDLPYFPNVSMGWDSSPRALQSDIYINTGYPFSPTISSNTPEAFKQALFEVKKFLQPRPDNQKIFTINCWNEWTEGSYLEPDTITGMKYLQAVKQVFRC